MTRHFALLMFLVCGLGLGMAQAMDGKAVIQQTYDRDDGRDSFFKMEMVLIDKVGDQRKRILDVYSKDYPVNLIKTYLKFNEPADIRGTKFLTIENVDGENTQYLYLPDLGRKRRIVSSQKNLRFVNTDFTYEDMQRRRPDKDEHKIIKEEAYNNWQCYVVESLPKDNSQYSKRISWVDKESFVLVKVEFYDKKNDLVKILQVEKLDKISGIWTVMRTVMQDLKEGHKTTMAVLEVKYNQGLDEGIFNQDNLEKE